MSFLDKLRAKRRLRTSVVLLFRMHYARSPDSLFVFFEGDEDELYFLPAIKDRVTLGKRVFSYICDGKNGVLESKIEVVQVAENKERLLFFVDKDFDDFLGGINYGDDNLYVTEYYSIENYVVNEDTLEIFNRLFMRLDSDVLDELRNQFQLSHARFEKIMIPFMVLTIALKRKRGVNVNLNNVNMANIIKINDELFPMKAAGAKDKFFAACGCKDETISRREYRRVWKEVRGVENKSILRGKFELWYFVRFLKFAWEGLSGTKLTTGRVVKVTFDPTVGNLFAVMSGNLCYPASLDRFLDRHIRV